MTRTIVVAILLAACTQNPHLSFQERQAIEAEWRKDINGCGPIGAPGLNGPLTAEDVDGCIRMVNQDRLDRLAGRPTQWERMKSAVLPH
jgi:hypothetical protein